MSETSCRPSRADERRETVRIRGAVKLESIMHQGFRLSLAFLLAGAGLALAQAPVPSTSAASAPATPALPDLQGLTLPWLPAATPTAQDALVPSRLDSADFWPSSNGSSGPRFWVQSEYMIGWMNGSSPSRQGFDPGALSGVRLSVGGSLDPNRTIGLEGSGLWMQQRSSLFNAPSTRLDTLSPGFGNPISPLPSNRR